DTEATIVDPPHPRELTHVRGEIAFENVSFAYNEGDWVLRDVSLKISAAESVAIVGATGAGKTSIISLISRFYDVQKGRILLDGLDLRELRQADVRKHVGVVLQDPFLFAGTIASNPEIVLGLDEATSSVDTETEHLIQDALAKLMVGRTSIIIAHRLSTIQNVDRIIVLHKGRVVEMGSHRDLLSQRGVYHRLY